MVLSISRPCLGLRIGLLSRLLSSWVSLGGMVWFGCFLGGCLLLTVHCLLIYSNQTGVPAYACGILLYVRLFVYSCFGFFVCLLWFFFSFFVSWLYVSSWRTIFIYCLCREPCPYFRVSVTWFLSWLVLPQPSIRIPPYVGATPGAGTQWCSRMHSCTCCIDVNLNPAPYGIRHILWWALVSLVAPLQFW